MPVITPVLPFWSYFTHRRFTYPAFAPKLAREAGAVIRALRHYGSNGIAPSIPSGLLLVSQEALVLRFVPDAYFSSRVRA